MALSLLLSAGCTHVLPAVPTPGPVPEPPIDAPLEPGLGRLYIDVVDGPTDARVVHPVDVSVTLNDLTYEDRVLVTDQECRTPCVVDVPLGRALLAFPMRSSRREEVDAVAVSLRPTLYRKALGYRQSGGAGFVLGVLGVTFGGASFATGASLFPVGVANNQSGLTTAGVITLGAGALLTAISIWAIYSNPAVLQPGAGAQYDIGP